MSGILNNKSRIMDVILTNEGKRQLANGALRANFYSFTDSSVIYSRDTIESGSLSETHRFILEASDNPNDQITFEASDAGLLTSFPISGSEKYSILNGQIFSGSQGRSIPITGSIFASIASSLLSSSIDSFKNQQILKSPDLVNDELRFILGNKKVNFDITNNVPFEIKNNKNVYEANINHIESFFQDKRLSHIPNFMFLPPKNKSIDGSEATDLGQYINIKQKDLLTKKDLDNELEYYKLKGYEKEITFLETSSENNLIAQMFEISNNEVKKLDIIDFGIFEETNEHVFFVGKVFIDDYNSQTFVHMFTIVFKGV